MLAMVAPIVIKRNYINMSCFNIFVSGLLNSIPFIMASDLGFVVQTQGVFPLIL